MKKYIVNIDYNNSTHQEFESNNLRESVKAATQILRGSVFLGSNFRYDITETTGLGIIKSVSGFKGNDNKLYYR